MFWVFWDNPRSKLKDKQYKEKALRKSDKSQIKITPNPGLVLN